MVDEHLNQCRICVAKRTAKYRRDNPERVAIIAKRKYNKLKLNPDFARRRLEQKRKHYSSEINRASKFVHYQLRKNKPEFCFACKERPAEDAHHPDYQRPDYVQWLCKRCHMRLHHSVYSEANPPALSFLKGNNK
jgi:hypothetical protein